MRVLRRARDRREPLSDAVKFHLLSGDFPTRGRFETAFEVWFLSDEQKRDLWQEHRAELLDEWISEHGGSRPWCWWHYEALEPRRCVSGTELLLPKHAPTDWEWHWRQHFGIPAFVRGRPAGFKGLPEVEAEAVYLNRHGLLNRTERARLGDDAFEPVPIDPFLTDEGEVEELKARGQARRAAERLAMHEPTNGHRHSTTHAKEIDR